MAGILVLRGGGIGDLVCTFPALRLIRAAFPGRRIVLAGRRGIAPLASALGVVDESIAADGSEWTCLHTPGAVPDAGLATRLRTFDRCYHAVPPGAAAFASRLRGLLAPGALLLEIPATPAPGRPAWLHFAEPLRSWGIDPDPAATLPPLAPLPADPPRDAPSGLWAIHPGSGSPAKNWPLHRWIEWCRLLGRRDGRRVLVLGGEAEAATAPAWEPLEREGIIQRAGDLPLVEAAARLAGCAAFAGHDSGFSHLAAALGLPTLALFGPTDPAVWAPFGPHVRVLHHTGPWDDLPARRVMDVFLHMIGTGASQMPR
jgi:ADP-heptose:LPS heptosyltransferase